MAKRSIDKSDSEWIISIEEQEDSEEQQYVRVMLNKNINAIVIGEATGKEYRFIGGGSTITMNKKDADILISKMNKTISCCGTVSSPKFVILEE